MQEKVCKLYGHYPDVTTPMLVKLGQRVPYKPKGTLEQAVPEYTVFDTRQLFDLAFKVLSYPPCIRCSPRLYQVIGSLVPSKRHLASRHFLPDTLALVGFSNCP